MNSSRLNIRLPLWGVLSLALALLSGCATYAPSLPPGYTGPTASIKDSAEIHSASKVDFFYVRRIDGQEIKNSHYESIARNQGHGFSMDPVVLDRDVPARPMKLEVVARTEYAAPILALTNAVYQVKGTVELTPEATKRYVVRGGLGADYSAVWIEDESSHQVVTTKIEVHGSAKLGFLQK